MPHLRVVPKAKGVLDYWEPRIGTPFAVISPADLDDAEREILEALPSAPPEFRVPLHSLLGTIHWRRNDGIKAAEAFRAASELQPANPILLTNLVMALRAGGRIEEATRILQEARQRAGQDPEAEFALSVLTANLFHSLGHDDAAVAAYGRAVTLADPHDGDRAYRLAMTAAGLGLEDDATEFFARYLVIEQGLQRGDSSAVLVIRGAPSEHLAPLKANDTLRGAVSRAMERYDLDALNSYDITAPERVRAFLDAHPPVRDLLILARAAVREQFGEAPVTLTLLGDPTDGELSVRIRYGANTREVMEADERFFNAWWDGHAEKARGLVTIGVRRG